MVRRAFGLLSDLPTRLFAFSDDMDGLRKVPDNVPNPDLLRPHLGKPLTAVPDPFGTHDSFGAHNNARLRAFLDRFGFDYEFQSATDCYRSGRFDQTLMTVLQRYDEVMAVMLPSLGRSARRPTARSCRSAPAPAASSRCRSPTATSMPAPSSSRTRTDGRSSSR